MIRRRNFLRAAIVAVPSAIIGAKLTTKKPICVTPAEETIRVCTAEVDDYDNPIPGDRGLTWTTADTDLNVGATLQFERTWKNSEVERWRAVVTHVYDIHTGEDLV